MISDARSSVPAGTADAEATEGRTRRRPPMPSFKRLQRWLLSDTAARWASRVLAVLVWQALGMLFNRIPTPAGTIEFIIEEAQRGELFNNVWVSLRRAAAGLSVVLVVGVLMGAAMGRWWQFRYFTTDLVMVGIALPAFIWAILGVMWWGFSDLAPIMVCILSATPMLIVNTREGADAVNDELLKMSAAYRVPGLRRFRQLIIPSMAEYIMAGFRVAVLAGWGAVLLVEWFGNNQGAGYRAHYWYEAGNFDGLMGWGLIMLVVIVFIDRAVLERILRRCRRWRAGELRWSS